MLKDFCKKINKQTTHMRKLSKRFDMINSIINDVRDDQTLNSVKTALQDLKPLIKVLENNILTLEKALANDVNVVDNPTLLISEVQNKVVLPYTVDELKEILNTNSNYAGIQDVIDNVYTLPLENYKNSLSARFKEAYNLMRIKENSSVLDSLNLAIELSFNNLLNPAIITACKNLDELDIYLDCLSSNELDKFNLFKIKYEISPRK